MLNICLNVYKKKYVERAFHHIFFQYKKSGIYLKLYRIASNILMTKTAQK